MALDLIGRGSTAIRNSMDSLLGQPKGDPTGIAGGFSGTNMYGGDPTGIRGGAGRQIGFDPLLDGAMPQFDQMLAKQQEYWNQTATGQTSSGYSGGASAGIAGGNWAALDAHNNEINKASSKYGVPANLLKAMVNQESSGNWGNGGSVWINDPNAPGGGFNILPFVGMKEATAKSLGLDYNSLMGNKQAQIDSMAQLMAKLASQYGGWENGTKVYFGGEQALSGGYQDVLGMDSETYGSKVLNNWKSLDSMSGAGSYGGGRSGYDGVGGGTMNSPSDVVNTAMSYVNQAPYVWGSVPGADKDPTVTGWDCSGMISWLNSKYAPNSGVPAGSHYQYEWAKKNGNLFMDSNQLKPGDIVFFDTNSSAGGGAGMNNASHVGMYIGNGKIVHAANETAGTIISDLAAYQGMYTYLGGAHMPWSGGGAGVSSGYVAPNTGPSAPASYSMGDVMYNLMMGKNPGGVWG